MKTIFAVIAALFLASLPAAAFEKDFIEAQTAYDEGRYSDASMLYADMVSNGVDNVALQYNLANALFKGGDLPEAIWHYRKAYYAAPRDPDIGANMHFALNAAGAIETGAQPDPAKPRNVVAKRVDRCRRWRVCGHGVAAHSGIADSCGKTEPKQTKPAPRGAHSSFSRRVVAMETARDPSGVGRGEQRRHHALRTGYGKHRPFQGSARRAGAAKKRRPQRVD